MGGRDRAWLLVLFFVSGATALVYQTVWSRQLVLVLGTSTLAISTVLAAFMAGLGLGSLAAGQVADQLRRPLVAYGVLEISIGAFALLFPLVTQGLGPIHQALWSEGLSSWTIRCTQFAVVTTLLLLPTAAMGATLPILAPLATDRLSRTGTALGTLYGANTAGAVVGTALAGFVGLPVFGLWRTTVLAAVANGCVGLVALALARGAPTTAVRDDVARDLVPPDRAVTGRVAVALGLAGMASLVYEVAWTRVVGLMIGGSTYAFSLMLLAFLGGIAVGGALGGRLADTWSRREGQPGVLRALAGVEVAVALLSWGLMAVYPELPYWYVWLFDGLGGASGGAVWLVSLLVAMVVMTPPAVLMGMAVPLAARAVVRDAETLGGPVGRILGLNTLGGVIGATVAGMWLLPTVGVQGAVLTAGAANLAAAVVTHPTGVTLAVSGMAAALMAWARPPWDPLLMTAGTYHYASHFEDHSREGIYGYAAGRYELLFYEEGLTSVVTVARSRSADRMWLALNGKVEASTSGDMPTQELVALLALERAQRVDDVLVIGLASGVTAGAVTLAEDVRHLEVVEIEPACARAARLFRRPNRGVLDDPRTRLVFDDGRTWLRLASPGAYDVVVSQPSNPWISGVSSLFTDEMWTMGRTRLARGGVWAQWVQTYALATEDLLALLRTFALAFPHVQVYAPTDDADLILLGSDVPLVVRRSLVAAAGHSGALHLEPLLDRSAVLDLTEGAGTVTDDNMRIEYAAPWALHRDTSAANMARLRGR